MILNKSDLYVELRKMLSQNGVKFKEREMAFFMAIFDHNESGKVDLRDVAKIIFDEKITNYYFRKHTIPKGPCEGKEQYKSVDFELEDFAQLKRVDKNQDLKLTKIHPQFDRCRDKLQEIYCIHGEDGFSKWKAFDVNKDGYVSLEDIKAKLVGSAAFGVKDVSFLIDHFGNIN